MTKKSTFFIFMLLSVFLLFGCGKSESENNSAENDRSVFRESSENSSETVESESSESIPEETSASDSAPNYKTYSDTYVSFEYDSNLLFYIESDSTENPLVAIFCSSIPSDYEYVRSTQIGFLTVQDTLSAEPSEFVAQLGLTTLTKTFCQTMFSPTENESIVDEKASYSDCMAEYYMELSDGSKCYTKALNYNDHITLAVMCLCEYSSEYNDSFMYVYNSAKSKYGNYDLSEEAPAVTSEPTATPEPTKTPESSTTSEPAATPSRTPDSTVTTGQRDALKKAKSYLKYSSFSYNGLIGQLEYEGFSTEDATYAVDNCGADWDEQALLKAKSYLEHSAFSYKGLIEQLEYEEFTTSQATYGADNCGADWNEQAVKKGKSYLEFSTFSKNDLISQLEFEGFTHDQAVYGAESNGL